ncbi:MAG: hypothetical protein HeimC2_18620 [Candidatus Heimdallarchaeota archaeon LC_2]|nr:MAG: hypothetical protein HeimC2_18620 [Candidatus Heimdallarchaeota archaeon LC_2]
MDFVSELIPKKLGRDQYRSISSPLIITFLYFALLYLQTFIKESNDENTIGYTYFFKGYFSSFSFPSLFISFNFFTVSFFAIWISIRTINLNGNIGNVGISALIFGSSYFLFELIFYLSFINEFANNIDQDFEVNEFISANRELLFSNFLFNLLEFMFLALIFAGIYFEVTKNLNHTQGELYPKI